MQENSKLSSSEISNLWTHYLRETMAICVSRHALITIKDKEIHAIFELALDMSRRHVENLVELFNKESFPIPKGFSNEDVNLKAPPLFSDVFWLKYIHDMTMHGGQAFSLAFNVSIRQDIRNFYYQCNIDTMDLYNKSIEVLISKNLYDYPPSYLSTSKVNFIPTLDYVTDLIGQKRKTNSIESGNIFFNLKKSVMAKAIIIGFKQVCKSNDVRQFLEKSLHTKNKHIMTFSSILSKDNLNFAKLLDTEITNSTIPPFSDKLMAFHVGFLFSAAISYYGTALIASMRADIAVLCEKAILEDFMIYSRFGKLTINNKWLEQPPEADSRITLPFDTQ